MPPLVTSGTYSEYKDWDRWYVWRYMTQFVFDDEQLYEIGGEWFQHEIEKNQMQKDFVRKVVKRDFKRCWQYSWKECKVTIK